MIHPALLFEIVRVGLSSLWLHKLRSVLTSLGIILGVFAVVVMVAVGEGNKRQALADIERLGARNIIVRSVKPPDPETPSNRRIAALAYGVTTLDRRRLESTVQGLASVVPVKRVAGRVSRRAAESSGAVLGVTPALREVTTLRVRRGRYLTEADLDRAAAVAVIGAELAARLFPIDDPLGGRVLVSGKAFTVVGVLAPASAAMVGRDVNFDVHIPMTTARARFGDMEVRSSAGSFEAVRVEYSQLILAVAEGADVLDVADQVRRVLELEHPEYEDVSIVVPMELLEQRQRTIRQFNQFLAAIAGISLLVGGIGIMNIMLATVTERTREIGIRRALGATRFHITLQFLVETGFLSAMGGTIGVVGGLIVISQAWALQRVIEDLAQPVATLWSIALSFGMAVGVGVLFGLYPALTAAKQDPIVALRHD